MICPVCLAKGPDSRGTSQLEETVLFCYPITKQKRALLVVEWRVGMGPGQSLETGMVTS